MPDDVDDQKFYVRFTATREANEEDFYARRKRIEDLMEAHPDFWGKFKDNVATARRERKVFDARTLIISMYRASIISQKTKFEHQATVFAYWYNMECGVPYFTILPNSVGAEVARRMWEEGFRP